MKQDYVRPDQEKKTKMMRWWWFRKGKKSLNYVDGLEIAPYKMEGGSTEKG